MAAKSFTTCAASSETLEAEFSLAWNKLGEECLSKRYPSALLGWLLFLLLVLLCGQILNFQYSYPFFFLLFFFSLGNNCMIGWWLAAARPMAAGQMWCHVRPMVNSWIELNWVEVNWIGGYRGFERLAANDPLSWLAVETGATNGKQNGVVKQKSNASSPALPVPISYPLSTYKRHKSPAKFHPLTEQSDSSSIPFAFNPISFNHRRRVPSILSVSSNIPFALQLD